MTDAYLSNRRSYGLRRSTASSRGEAVQAMLAKGLTNTPKAYRHSFTYRGLISCGRCQALVTAENTTNRYGTRYVYYHCCRKNRLYGFCPERSIDERDLQAQLAAFLDELALPGPILKFVERVVPELHAEMAGASAETAKRLKGHLAEKSRQMERLRMLCATDVITPDELVADRERLMSDQRRLEEQLRLLEDQERLIEPVLKAISFVNHATTVFQEGDAQQRRQVVQTVSSNLILTDRIVAVQAKKPFTMFLKLKGNPELWAV